MDRVYSFFRQFIDLTGDWTSRFGGISGGLWLFGVLAFIFVFLYGISIGRTRAMVSLLSIYVAYTLTLLFPYSEQLRAQPLVGGIPSYLIQASLFLALYVVIMLVLNLSIRNRLSIGDIAPWQVFVISVLQIGLLASIIVQFIPRDMIPEMLNKLLPYIAGEKMRFIWGVASVAVFPFLRSRRRID